MRYQFVDRMIEMAPGKSAKALKNITASEDVFNDHFPHFPVYPGALLIETMAQVAGLLVEKTVAERDNRRVLPVLSIVKNAKFREATLPGDTLIIDAAIESCTNDAAMVRATVSCDGRERAASHLFFTLLDVSDLLDADELRSVDAVKKTIDRVSAFHARRRKAQ
jgi:3-hydroxyacyl-[acyl-carrier-protein] dehydratase